MAVAADRVQDLTDHVEDGTAGEGVERELERLRCDLVADHAPDERRTTADEACERKPAPRGRDRAERADDAESLGRVVQREADDQHGREADLAGTGRHADRKALGEVVQSDRDRDHHSPAQGASPDGVGDRLGARERLHRQRCGLRPAGDRRELGDREQHAALDDRQAGAAEREAAEQQGGVARKLREAAAAALEGGQHAVKDLVRVLHHVDKDEREDSDREHRERDAHSVAEHADPPDREAEIDREPCERSEQRGVRERHGASSGVFGLPK